MTIIDSHCHAWEVWPYDPPVPDPASRGRVKRLLWEMDSSGVSRAILIAAGIRHNPRNADYAQQQAHKHPGRLIAFPDVDCRWSPTHHAPGADGRLEATVARRAPVGFTHYLDEKADPSWLTSPDGAAFFAVAEKHRLIVSLSCGPSQMAAVRALARRFPDTPFLLHHLGWVPASPRIDSEALRAVVNGAAEANLFVKFSGFGYAEGEGWNFPCDRAREVAKALYQAYGPQRLIWGSDYPVSQRYMTYRQSLEIVRAGCDFIGERDMALVLGGAMGKLLSERGCWSEPPVEAS